MLLRSLFCFEGADQAARFSLISLSAYLGFVLSFLLFSQVPLLLLLLLGSLFVMLGTSALRRANDAGVTKSYAALVAGVFVLVIAARLFSATNASYFLLILGFFATMALALPVTAKPRSYVFGYDGPKTELVQTVPITSRIEPTLVGTDPAGTTSAEQPPVSPLNASGHQGTHDAFEPLRVWYNGNRKLALMAAAASSLIAVILTIVPNLEFASETAPAPEQATKPMAQQPVKIRDYALEMPNDYYLMLDQNDGLVIHWRSGDSDNPALWSILTGKGEASCQALVFNDNTQIRTNLVSVENGGDYYAELSPLDTKTAVQAIADKGHFSLCGYEFSLKGSRATIDGSETYYVFLQ